MKYIKRFFECLVPITQCNLKCEYCYVIQENRRELRQAEFRYGTEVIKQALKQERLGGACYFSICGAGETLMQQGLDEIIKVILENGHYINITTNGTYTRGIDCLLAKLSSEQISRMHISFSFHYIELVRKNLLDVFFNNIAKVKKAGASFILQLNLYDGYIDSLDEIMRLSIQKVGALPQIALTRIEPDMEVSKNTGIHSKLSYSDYRKEGDKFDSPLFKFTCDNFMVKRKEFCYAGDWAGALNLATGILKPCYMSPIEQNIFEDASKPIHFHAIGKNCPSPYCSNSSHFLSLGVIPELNAPTYAALRERREAGWYNSTMREVLNKKLSYTNKMYSKQEQRIVTIRYRFVVMYRCFIIQLKRQIKKLAG